MSGRTFPSLLRQAELLDGMVGHCLMRGGVPAGEALIGITGAEARELQALARLRDPAADRRLMIARPKGRPHEVWRQAGRTGRRTDAKER
ncbi:hypothetical protein NE852_12795 [Rhizobium sp. Pop5]|uniref:hypothetical protein n=1 Tax=Rhizobium sp. Pop5 TaxID=1223565 RepID=UPI002156FDF8|nr:hypothetical protein [Rhizobium sp. Pop5]UVD59005.1 hypothetical protein NE852_12795 [Rhizobium sp. Pop5]